MPGEDRLEKMKAMAAAAQAEKENKAKEELERGGGEQEAKGAERAEVEQALAGATAEAERLSAQLAEAEGLATQMADLPADARAEFDVELAALRSETEAARATLTELNARKATLDAGVASEPSTQEAGIPAEAVAQSPAEAAEVKTTESARDEFLKKIDQATSQTDQMIVIPSSDVVAEFKANPQKRSEALTELQKPESKNLSSEFLTAQTEFARKILETFDAERLTKYDQLSKGSELSETELKQSLRDYASELLQSYGYGRGEVYHPRREVSETQRKTIVQAALDFGPKAIAEKLRTAQLKHTSEALGFAEGKSVIQYKKGEQPPYDQHIKASVTLTEIGYILKTDNELEKEKVAAA